MVSARIVSCLAFALLGATDGSARPPRIVSINPCIDAVLMQVADPGQIAAISHYSMDPRATSIPIPVAHRFRATSGTAEEIVALSPDIVLGTFPVPPATVRALNRMHIRLIQVPIPQSIAESEGQMRKIATIAGHSGRGNALAARIAAAAVPLRLPPVTALIWQNSGLVPGAGTLPDEMMRRAGFRNISASYGLKQWDVLPLEYLVARPPRVLFSVGAVEHGGDRMTSHPAVRALGARMIRAPFPERLISCAGPTIIDAMTRLKAVRRGIAR